MAASHTATSSKPRAFDRDIDGILLLDKPLGISSNRALQQARILYRAMKAGHAGSLDPLATGMLPVCFGQATKVCAFLLDSFKTYRFEARLGERTATGDSEGEVVERQAIPLLTEEHVRVAFESSLGQQTQIPPMYSALKHQGRRLYELARQGQEVERPSRRIELESLRLVRLEGDLMEVVVRCSKGTYVRTLAEDLARKLGTVAHLTALRREQVDPFSNYPMHTLEALEGTLRHGGLTALDELLLPMDLALGHLGAVEVDEEAAAGLIHGQSVSGAGVTEGEWVRIYGPGRLFLGLGEGQVEDVLQPRRLLVKSAQSGDLS